MTRDFDSRHWNEGGSFITNLSGMHIAAAEEAVRRFGDDNLVVKPTAEPPVPPEYGASLHFFGIMDKEKGLSSFWKVFDAVLSELKEAESHKGG